MPKKDVHVPCGYCGCTDLPLHTCTGCRAKQYCGRTCQAADWKAGHKAQCAKAPSALPPKAEDHEVCAICLEALNEATVCTLPCGHKFDGACVDAMRKFGVTQVCPCCRAKLPPSADHQFQDAFYRHVCTVGTSLFIKMSDAKTSSEELDKLYADLTPTQKKEIHRVVRVYKASAEQGSAMAQNHLGVMYNRGLHVPKSYATAVKWYHRAAAQGYKDAQFNLAAMYRLGKGAPIDCAAALDLYKKAAAQGDADSLFDLGGMYYTGAGVQKDEAAARTYFRGAADKGHLEACYNLIAMGAPLEAAHVQMLQEAADHGQVLSLFALGVLYQNTAKAFPYFKAAADRGHPESAMYAAACYASGTGCPRDIAAAFHYFTTANRTKP